MKNKLILLALSLICALALSYWRASSQASEKFQKSDITQKDFKDTLKHNIIAHLETEYKLLTSSEQLHLMKREALIAHQYLVFFSAWANQKKTDRDIYMMQVTVGRNAIPIGFSPPRNLTLNPMSEDILFAADSSENKELGFARILYGQKDKFGNCLSITFLNWATHQKAKEESVPIEKQVVVLLEKAKEAHHYDLWFSPESLSTRFSKPLKNCTARLVESQSNQFIILADANPKYKISVDDKHITALGDSNHQNYAKSDEIELVSVGSAQQATFVQSIQNALRSYELITKDEDISLTHLKSKLSSEIDQTLFKILVDPKSPSFKPVGPISSINDAKTSSWYPPKIDVKSAYPGEGVWKELKLGEEKEVHVLKTFIRVDEQHPQLSVHLFAFDMRKLGIKLVAGGDPKKLEQEGIGSGKIKNDDLSNVVAAFNGANDIYQQHGLIQDQQILSPMRQGVATIAINQKGKAVVGVMDTEVEALIEDWGSFRQSYAPLVYAQGEQNQNLNVIQPQSEHGKLDDLYLSRSALGVTPKGTLIYAWSESATVAQINKALKLVGVEFAMSLSSDQDQTGLALFPSAKNPVKAIQKMSLDPQKWLEGTDQDFFYLMKTQSIPSAFPSKSTSIANTWNAKEGVWQQVPFQDVDPWLAVSYLSTPLSSEVSFVYIDSERLTPHLALGYQRGSEFENEISLPDIQVARLPIGLVATSLLSQNGGYGLKYLGKDYIPAVDQEMTFVINDQYVTEMDKWYTGSPVQLLSNIQTLIQGQTLIYYGKNMVQDATKTGEPLAALGRFSNGDLLLATIENGDMMALSKALELSGVENAMLLSVKGSNHIGQNQYFYQYQGKLYYAYLPEKVLRPAYYNISSKSVDVDKDLIKEKNVLISPEDALILTHKPTTPKIQIISSFKDLK